MPSRSGFFSVWDRGLRVRAISNGAMTRPRSGAIAEYRLVRQSENYYPRHSGNETGDHSSLGRCGFIQDRSPN